ncbi:MAG TPA: sulfurtransferase/chromate resistance protein [Sphingomicrobium sp.]|nr:sulfurtransferase/chromate resistance protein [Sphingomicrobium sp.]
MSATNSISPEKLARLIGIPNCPVIIDVRPDGNELLPASQRHSAESVSEWARSLAGQKAVVTCVHGKELSAGVAAILRSEGADAEILEGGFAAWNDAGLPVIDATKLPQRDPAGRTVWVTRARPKVDRIACPWLIRRFVDPTAVFLFVAPGEVAGVAERFGATPFDVDGVFWSHRGENCSFDTMIEELGLTSIDALARLAAIVRGADTARPEIAPQAAGLLAASLGLSRMYSDDLEQLEAGMLIYDAFYRWCRDAVDETHDWVSHKPRQVRQPVNA